jgi:hypothetical protein
MALSDDVLRAVEIKRIVADLTEELHDIEGRLDESDLDRLDYEGHSAVKVSQVRRLFSQAEACKLLGKRAAGCFYDKPVVFWKFN